MNKPNPYTRSSQDYLLAGLACCSALISTGLALAQVVTGLLFAVIAAVGLTFSYLSDRNNPVKSGNTDGLLMAVACACAVIFVGTLNSLMPLGGYPMELRTSSVLSWMVVLSAFFAWRDGTLLFLMVPSIAMFGLVGAYDTFREAAAVFFLFLVSLAVLFARAHLRHSLKFAEQEGHEAHQLRRYEWSALAGPEWALGSALVVVAFSAIGAPVIQNSVQGVTGNLRVDDATIRAIRRNVQNQVGENQSDTLQVGRGPIGAQDDTVVLAVEANAPFLLRQRHYASFNDGRWQSWTPPRWTAQRDRDSFNVSEAGYFALPTSFMNATTVIRGEVRGPGIRSIPYPGEPLELNTNRRRTFVALDGTITFDSPLNAGERFRVASIMPPAATPETESKLPVEFPARLRDAYTSFQSTDTVASLARRITENIDGDYAKALRIQQEVTQRITYNLAAPAVPDREDPVETVLFRTQQGYCDLFASSVAQMARAIGLTARVATGFLTDPADMEGERYVVRQRYAHMWAEIYFDGVGWVPFDATEGAREIPGQGRGDRRSDNRPFWERFSDPLFVERLTQGLGILVFLAAGWVAWKVILAQQGRGRMPMVKPIFAPIELAVAGALRKIERASGTPRKFEQTSTEYLNTVAPGLPETTALATLIDRALFSPDRATLEELDAATKAFLASAFPPQSKAS